MVHINILQNNAGEDYLLFESEDRHQRLVLELDRIRLSESLEDATNYIALQLDVAKSYMKRGEDEAAALVGLDD